LGEVLLLACAWFGVVIRVRERVVLLLLGLAMNDRMWKNWEHRIEEIRQNQLSSSSLKATPTPLSPLEQLSEVAKSNCFGDFIAELWIMFYFTPAWAAASGSIFFRALV
jgi:hypothetical protein